LKEDALKVDVAIIGASSAGLYAAERLARAGRSVAVFERQATLAPARRTLIITPQLRRVLGYLPNEAVLHQTATIEVLSPAAQARVQLNTPDLIVERRQMIEHLAVRAEWAGATLWYDHRFWGMIPGADGVELNLGRRDGTRVVVRANAVIGADGAFSAVAPAAGLACPPLVQIVQAELMLPEGWDPQVTRVWFDAAQTRYFYWLIPESDRRGCLGVITDDTVSPHDLLQDFLQRQNLQPLAYQASRVAMYHPSLKPWGRVGKHPVFLVGDAAGQVKVTTVGGTVSGFYGADAAVMSILHGVPPQRALRQVKRELDLHWWLRWTLERLDNPAYDRLIDNITPSVQGFLAHRNRDEMAVAIWRLPLLRPQLLSLGMSALRRRGKSPAQLRPQRLPSTETKLS
jgi:flavin-dependent dehydrogenase